MKKYNSIVFKKDFSSCVLPWEFRTIDEIYKLIIKYYEQIENYSDLPLKKQINIIYIVNKHGNNKNKPKELQFFHDNLRFTKIDLKKLLEDKVKNLPQNLIDENFDSYYISFQILLK